MNGHKTHVGVDIAKRSFDAVVYQTGEHRTFESTPPEIAQAVRWIGRHQTPLVVMEATGGYERDVAEALSGAHIDRAIMNPRWTRRFAESQGRLAKTDKIDAAMLAEYAEKMEPAAQQPTLPALQTLHELVTRRNQLVKMRVMERGHCEHVRDDAVGESILRLTQLLTEQIDAMNKTIADHIAREEELQAKVKLMQTVPGVGATTAALLLSEMPELGSCNRQQVGALAGLAPMNRDSGTFSGKRSVRGGRKQVRTGLYMAAVTATRSNPSLRVFYQRLRDNGKPWKVAITAVMRKLLIILNSILARNESWEDLTKK